MPVKAVHSCRLSWIDQIFSLEWLEQDVCSRKHPVTACGQLFTQCIAANMHRMTDTGAETREPLVRDNGRGCIAARNVKES